MQCPSCHYKDTAVIDSRSVEEGLSIRRRRECPKCLFRFSTSEEMEILSLNVIKRDGSHEPFDDVKLIRGIQLSLHKRPVTLKKVQRVVLRVEQEIQTRSRKDCIASSAIGEIVMKHLKRLDKVAYVRFASVYRSFEDVSEFAKEVKQL